MSISLHSRRYLQLGCLVLFAVLSVGINFFHTENTPADQANCPACHFLAFSQSVGPVLSFVLPLLIILGTVCIEILVRFHPAGTWLFLSRSPPSA
jgi:hypothetical protein